MKKAILILTLALLPLTANAGVLAELMMGNRYTALDVQLDGNVVGRIGFLFRHVAFFSYVEDVTDIEVSTYTFADGVLKGWGGIDAIGGIEASADMGAVPHLGLQFTKKWKTFKLYLYAFCTVRGETHPKGGVLLSYTPALNNEVNWLLQLETFHIWGPSDFYNSQNARLGFNINSYNVGVALNNELNYVDDDLKVINNIGVFMSKGF
jgi:hypothetical protein